MHLWTTAEDRHSGVVLWNELLGQSPASDGRDGGGADELWAEVAERTRLEYARTSLADRLRGCVESPVRIDVAGAGTVAGTLRGVGPDWLLVDESGRSTVVALAAVLEVRGLGHERRLPDGVVADRSGLGLVLRAMARDRDSVRVVRTDGGLLHGRFSRVGADHVDIVASYDGEVAPAAPQGPRCVAMTAIALVRVVDP
jgi:hypothetical protein